jgi:cytochrome c-type biogenesis protein CcmH
MWYRDGQAGPAQPGDIEGHHTETPTVARGWDLKIRLDKVH